MNSLEWRTKKLENKILGEGAGLAQVERILSQSVDQPTIYEQLNTVARHYRNFIDHSGPVYERFVELHEKYQSLAKEFDTSNSDLTAKADLVLAYEEDLIKYTQDIKSMAEKADRVLNFDNWPDLISVQDRVDNLQKITKEQHLQSVVLDRRTEELIELYNEIISSFKNNMTTWNQKLEAYENQEKRPEEDE